MTKPLQSFVQYSTATNTIRFTASRDRNTKEYVAIKITIAEADSMPESKILNSLALSEPSDEGYSGKALIPQVLDTFFLDGPNGRHSCPVTEPGMMTLAEAKNAPYSRLFELPVARAIATQAIQAVAFLHRRGVVHVDLHSGNIMSRLQNCIDDLSPRELYQKYGQPNMEPFERLDGKPLSDGIPTHGVVPIWIGKESELATPSEAKMFEIIGQIPLFEGFNPSSDWIKKEHVDALGKLPCDWWQKWDARERWFTEEATRASGEACRSLNNNFVDSIQEPRWGKSMEDVGEAEKFALLTVVRGMLASRPGEKLTATEIMESEWMRRYALPALGKVAG
ncbi:hypothetical protein BJX76DRAFT_366812 [Aspergillus varians]